MKRISKLFTIAILVGFLLNSCSSDDDFMEEPQAEVPEPDGAYTDGFFVLNEGNSGGGSVTFIENDLQNAEYDIYQEINEGDDLGLFLQSIFFEDDLAYIISNGSNIITVVDRYAFELVGKVESGLNVPRYGAVANGKAYVTNQANFEDTGATEFDDYVAVIDLETLEVEETIQLNAPAEYIKEEDNLFYVQNATYGTGNTISVLNPATNTIENTFNTNEGLSDYEVEDGFIYALSATELWKLDLGTGEEVSKIIFGEGNSASRLEVEDDLIYYTVGTAVYSVELGATSPAEDPIFEYSSSSSYGVMYGFEVENDKIYIADGGDFSSNSFVEIYTTSGELLEKIEVGIGPNGFYFND